MNFFESNGIRIHFLDEGPKDAAVLIFSNSIATELTLWDDVVRRLTPDFRVIRYDARGQGKSDAPTGPYTIAQMTDDVIALMDYLELTNASFCGLSLGGMVGMWLASQHPERIEKLVLCNTAVSVPPPEGWDARANVAKEGGMAAILPAVESRWLSSDFLQNSPSQVERLKEMVLQSPVEGYVGGCAAIRDMDQSQSVSAVQCPVLLVAGRHDPATPPEQLQRIQQLLVSSAEYVELDCGHMTNVEKPQELAQEISKFMKKG